MDGSPGYDLDLRSRDFFDERIRRPGILRGNSRRHFRYSACWAINRLAYAHMQGDVLKCAFLSHGDTKHILLLPSSVEECFSFAMEAFELAEKFQTPVFVLSDLDLGMNNWMADPFAYP